MFKKRKPIDRLDYISESYKPWYNTTRNVATVPMRTFRPSSKEDLQAIVKDAKEKKVTVRAVGAGHSFSEVAKEHYYLVEMFKLRDCSLYKDPALKEDAIPPERTLVRAQGGIRIKCLNKALFKMGLALDNMGTFDWQTISGALSTGTHGTGIHQPAIPDMVRAIVLICADGEICQIEPKNGAISDPDKFEGKLIQNDDVFYSVVLSFGAMGIIYELILEVGPKFWIKESRTLMDWDTELKPKLLNGYLQEMIENRYDFVSMRVNPYKTKDKKTGQDVRLCALALQKKYAWADPPAEKGWGAYFRNIASTLLGDLGVFSWLVVRWLNMRPNATPNSIGSAIKGSRDKLFIGPSFKVLYQTGLSIRKHGISSEFSFPVDYEHLVKLIDGACLHLYDCRTKYSLFQTSHIPIRFVRQSKVYLSPCFKEARMFVDFPTLEDVHGRSQIMQITQRHIIDRENGVPHWGKVNDYIYGKKEFIDTHYPMAQKWREVREKMDPEGMFLSDFVLKMGLR